ncbi:MAG: hypothetical protein ACJ77N_02365 [Chloroflexota bacterium]
MILRIFRGSVAADRTTDFHAYVDSVAAERLRGKAGLRDLIIGTRADGDRLRIAVASTWTDVRAEDEALGGLGPRSPVLELPDYVAADSAEHYELVSSPYVAAAATSGLVLRVGRLILKRGTESEFYQYLRERSATFHEQLEALVIMAARRMTDDHEEVATVGVFTDHESVVAAEGAQPRMPIGWDRLAPFVDDFTIEAFATTLVELAPL